MVITTQLNILTDEDLIKKAQRELPYNTKSFEVLTSRHYGYVSSICRGFFGQKLGADDVVQETFIRVFNALKSFKFESSFKTWLHRVALNECKRKFSKLNREKEKIEKMMSSRTASDSYSDSDEKNILLKDLIFSTMSKLPEKDREILALRFFSDLSINEISKSLEIGESAAKMRLTRATKKFKETYIRLSFFIIFICDFYKIK